MKTTFYLHIEPRFTTAGKLKEIRPSRVTRRYPSPSTSGEYVVKLTMTIPDEVFEPPEIDIQVRAVKVDKVDVKTEKPAAVSRSKR